MKLKKLLTVVSRQTYIYDQKSNWSIKRFKEQISLGDKNNNGSATAIMRKDDYIKEAERELSDAKSYTLILNKLLYPSSLKIGKILEKMERQEGRANYFFGITRELQDRDKSISYIRFIEIW